MIASLHEIPAVNAYLKRVGAEAINFKTAKITETRNGYPKDIGSVTFHADGTVSAWGQAEPPTPEEADAIKAAMETADLPKIVTLTAIAEPPPGCDVNDINTFICHDLRGQIVMVHQRYQTSDGGKGFLPWTYWSDGEWRKMEPEVMPFFGLPGFNEHSTLFIHEGSKAAARVKRIVSGEEIVPRFPWKENMRWGHHIGWIGGVFALERSDWAALAKLNWKRVVVVADNDPLGRNIVPRIAKKFNCPVFTLQFTDEWPENFDLGDEWPDELFGDESQYIGQPYERCIQPATWATDAIEIPPETPRGRPRIVYRIRDIFAEQWAWIEKVDQMVNIDMPQYRMKSSSFNAFVRPFSDTHETLKAFHQYYSGNQMALTYDPSSEATIVRNAAGLQAINLYQPSPIKPVNGDFEPWLEFMAYLILNVTDRDNVLRWIATLRAKPGTRILHGLLLMSEKQGTGKGTLGRILAELVGRDNSAFPGESMIVNSEFNGWLEGKRLIVVEEIYSGHSWKAYNKLKPYVTDETIEVNVKHQATWSMPNWTQYVLMSNSRAALKLEESDRRWLVPEITEVPWPKERFEEFHQWLRQGGYAHIAYWAHQYEKRGDGRFIRPGEIAPQSANKTRLIEESRSEAEQLLLQLAEEVRDHEEPVAVVIPPLKNWAAGRIDEKVYETPHAIARLLRNKGLWITDRVKVGGQKQTLAVNQEVMLEWLPEKLREHLKPPSYFIPDQF